MDKFVCKNSSLKISFADFAFLALKTKLHDTFFASFFFGGRGGGLDKRFLNGRSLVIRHLG
jgi:hypothetical protein